MASPRTTNTTTATTLTITNQYWNSANERTGRAFRKRRPTEKPRVQRAPGTSGNQYCM